MDARLRERRRVLRVSASQRIDRNVRRRPHRAGAFFVPRARIRSLASRPTCIPRGRGLASTSRAPCGCGSLHLLRPEPPTAAFARRVPRPSQSSTSGGQSCTLRPVSLTERFKNRHSFGNVRKAATHLKPAHSRAVTINAKLVPSKPQRFKNRHSSPDVS